MKLKNKTDSTQYIHRIDGGAYATRPNEIIEINEKIIYTEELNRALNFFDVVKEIKKTPIIQKKEENIKIPSKKDKEEGS